MYRYMLSSTYRKYNVNNSPQYITENDPPLHTQQVVKHNDDDDDGDEYSEHDK